MRKSCRFLLGLLLFIVPLGGCWDMQYLDEMAIVLAIGIDTGERQNYQVTVQVVNPSLVSSAGGKGGAGGGGAGGGASTVTTFSGSGQTMLEAIRKISTKTSRRLFFAHNQVLVIGEELARRGVVPLFEMIERSPEIRKDFYVIVSQGSRAEDALKVTTPIEKVPGTKIRGMIENVEKNLGTSYRVKVKDVIENIGSGKKEMVTGSIAIIGDPKQGGTSQNIAKIDPATIEKIGGLAVFKHAKLVDFLSYSESKGTSWLLGKMKKTAISVPCPSDQDVGIEIVRTHTTMKAKFVQGQPAIAIRVMQEANIGESLCPELDLSSKETFTLLEQKANEQTKQDMLAAVERAQTEHADIFGFADAVYKVKPAYWKQNKDRWDDIFEKIPVQVEVTTDIRRMGVRNKSILEKLDGYKKE